MPMAAAAQQQQQLKQRQQKKKLNIKLLLVKAVLKKLKLSKHFVKWLPLLSLAEAKKAVEDSSNETPSVIVESASKDDAKKMKETIEAAGAKVKLS